MPKCSEPQKLDKKLLGFTTNRHSLLKGGRLKHLFQTIFQKDFKKEPCRGFSDEVTPPGRLHYITSR